MIGLLCLAAAILVVAVIVTLALFGGAETLSLWQRRQLLALASGLVLAGPDRFLGRPPGFGDLVFLTSLLAFLITSYRQQLAQRIDALDGKIDGRLGALPLGGNVTRLKRTTGAVVAVALAVGFGAMGGRSSVHAEPFKPIILRVALQGPGRLGLVELNHFQDRQTCIAARDAFLKQSAEFTTPDGLKWTVLGARCAAPGTAA